MSIATLSVELFDWVNRQNHELKRFKERVMKLENFVLGLLIFSTSTSMALAQGATAGQYIAAGNQFYTAKDYAKAVQYYKYATTLDPNSAAAYQGLGNSYYGLGQRSDALAAYDKALQINPNNPQLASFDQSLRA